MERNDSRLERLSNARVWWYTHLVPISLHVSDALTGSLLLKPSSSMLQASSFALPRHPTRVYTWSGSIELRETEAHKARTPWSVRDWRGTVHANSYVHAIAMLIILRKECWLGLSHNHIISYAEHQNIFSIFFSQVSQLGGFSSGFVA